MLRTAVQATVSVNPFDVLFAEAIGGGGWCSYKRRATRAAASAQIERLGRTRLDEWGLKAVSE